MKKIPVLTIVAALLLVTSIGCTKNERCLEKTIESEEATMINYALTNGISATKHSSGLYYEIITPGNSTRPDLSSTLSVKYTGKLLDGTVFDSRTTTPVTFALGGVIFGWQLGLPLIGEGGKIKLIIPSSFAYGCNGKAPIEPYSILYFEVELIDVL